MNSIYYHLTQCGRAHDCQKKGRIIRSRPQRIFNLHPTCGLCGRNPGEGAKLGRNPSKVTRIKPSCSPPSHQHVGPPSQFWLQMENYESMKYFPYSLPLCADTKECLLLPETVACPARAPTKFPRSVSNFQHPDQASQDHNSKPRQQRTRGHKWTLRISVRNPPEGILRQKCPTKP